MKRNLALLAVATAALMAPRANAAACANTTDCVFSLNNTDVVGFGSGPFGTVELKLNSGAVDFIVDLADGFGFNIIDTGSHEGFSFNNAIGGTLSMSNFSSPLYSDFGAGPGSNSPFSSFTNAVQSSCTNGSGCGVNKLTFSVARTGGFTDVNQLIALSTGGGTAAYFAADIGNSAGVTGVVGATGAGTSVTPEPVSTVLVGTGLMSLFFIRRRRNSSGMAN